MNKQQLASKIWESANKMRSKIEANKYKDYILGFIFYKFLSDKEIELLKKDGWTKEDFKSLVETDAETVEYCQNKLGYFISYDNLFSTWLEMGNEFNVGNVRDGISAFNRMINSTHKKVFNKIFTTLDTGLSELGDSTGTQTKAINELIALIKDIPMDGKQDYDVLGFIYEYLIGNFAANAGKKAGEFYTPHEVSVLMSEIVAHHLKSRNKIEIYDPTSGSGSLLINIGKSVSRYIGDKENIRYYAQELKEPTYNLTRMNLVMRGILPDNIFVRNGDTLEEDWPYFDESDPEGTYDPLYVDAVVSNPPYSQAWDPKDKESDPRYSRYGLAPKGKADYAFLLHDLYHVKPDGIMTIVLPHGVLFRGGEEEKIRRNLVENDNIDTIIGLPSNIFFGTGIATIIIVLKQKRENSDVLIIDASKGFEKEGKNNKLRASDIKKIVDTIIDRRTTDKFSRVVSKEEIRQNGYNLNIPRYVDSSDTNESWDVHALMFGGIPNSEIAEYDRYWNTFKGLKEDLFGDSGTPYSKLLVDDIGKSIHGHESVIEWMKTHSDAFEDFPDYLREELIQKWESIDINRGESMIADAIFSRCDPIPLVDRYVAYQALDDEWAKIAVDLEIMQTEGFSSARRVDPNMVLKKDHEVQEGWVGRVIPFELVQSTILREETEALKQKSVRLSEIQSTYEEIIDSMSEEDKDSEILNDAKDAFFAAEVNKMVKSTFGNLTKAKSMMLSYDEGSIERIIVQVQELMDEEKNLKKIVKSEEITLHNNTKAEIEGLTDDKIVQLLETKWIKPIMAAIESIPVGIIDDLISHIKALENKYATTYAELAEEITKTKAALADMIDALTGGEYDMKGLEEFQALLRGGNND
ncbi:MAG: type I restriction-modification system subunit M [Bacteroidales bacterium]